MTSRAVPVALLAVLMLSVAPRAEAQTMSEVLDQLFVFSSGDDPLFLEGPNNAHGNHFIPAEAESNGALLAVFTNAIASNIGNFPLSSTVSSQTFSFVGGVPTPTSRSFGPIFAERAQTLGRGRFDVGFSYSSISFDKIRSTPMDEIQLTFLHENTDFPGCSTIFMQDCTLIGVPGFEHDVIQLELDLAITAEIYAFNATFGVTDWLDFGVAVPVVQLGIDGLSQATIVPAQVDNPQHFFGGTSTDPILSTNGSSRGSTTGIGDVAVRTKAKVSGGDETNVAVLAEVRVPTGREEDFLGAGEASARGMFIGSATLGDFAPHVNFGYIYRGGDDASDSFQLAAGFDQRLSPSATFVVDLLGDFKTGDALSFPDPQTFDPPIVRTVERSNVRNLRDDTLDAAIGIKLQTAGGVVLWSNALIALNDGGMRSNVIGTFGVQYSTR